MQQLSNPDSDIKCLLDVSKLAKQHIKSLAESDLCEKMDTQQTLLHHFYTNQTNPALRQFPSQRARIVTFKLTHIRTKFWILSSLSANSESIRAASDGCCKLLPVQQALLRQFCSVKGVLKLVT